MSSTFGASCCVCDHWSFALRVYKTSKFSSDEAQIVYAFGSEFSVNADYTVVLWHLARLQFEGLVFAAAFVDHLRALIEQEFER